MDSRVLGYRVAIWRQESDDNFYQSVSERLNQSSRGDGCRIVNSKYLKYGRNIPPCTEVPSSCRRCWSVGMEHSPVADVEVTAPDMLNKSWSKQTTGSATPAILPSR